ncbi:hypothetical protein N656DRAFT_413346 [Canariomyces notabilis]|uniref:Uncharacterized protein n=1 Tax=Canariomyces notabilis TaxID=2074819 RepID=A0AAN6QH39_9PEZI|nr:hypothetical protein N656DRAFT_413346 [Canariomyces arenarius]
MLPRAGAKRWNTEFLSTQHWRFALYLSGLLSGRRGYSRFWDYLSIFFCFITPYHPTKSLSTLICFRVREKPERP